MRFCLAESMFVPLGTVLLLSGCGGAFRTDEPLQGPLPDTNAHVAAHVVMNALENAGIPDGGGKEIRFSVSSVGKEHGIMEIVGHEFLIGRGYAVNANPESSGRLPECIIGIDTLFVNLDRDTDDADAIVRYASARIKAELTGTGSPVSAGNTINANRPIDTRQIYIGTAEYRDTFPRRLTDVTGTGAPYVNMFPSRERVKNTARPLLLGTLITALVWLLYSYRG